MGAFDLEGARRATAKPSPTTAQDPNGPLFWQWYARYTEPLHKDVAPLCGNGRVDTFEDYTVFYQQNPNAGAFTMPGPPGANYTHTFMVNEVCDDGNRLDGDGCAADCASMDSMTPACPLPTQGQFLLPEETAIEFIAFVDAASALVVTDKRVLLLNPENLTVASVIQAQKPFGTVRAGFYDASTYTVWLYVGGAPPAVWVLSRSANWMPIRRSQSPIAQAWNSPQRVDGSVLFLPIMSDSWMYALMLLSVEEGSMINLWNETQTPLLLIAPPAPASSSSPIRVARTNVAMLGGGPAADGTTSFQIMVVLESLHTLAFEVQIYPDSVNPLLKAPFPTSWSPSPPMQQPMGMDLWLDLFRLLVLSQSTPLIAAEGIRAPARFYHSFRQASASPQTAQSESVFEATPFSIALPFAFYARLLSVRMKLINTGGWIDGMGDPSARLAAQLPSFTT